MGRRQVPLDGQGQVVRFAAKLRQARESAGLTLRKLAEGSGYSASTLSTAENGKKLPSWDVVEAFVRTCGETDIPRWRGWWEAAVDDDHAEPAQAAEPAELAQAATASYRDDARTHGMGTGHPGGDDIIRAYRRRLYQLRARRSQADRRCRASGSGR
jgi:transcriptional regulator with XRE-family HTH domain